MAIAKGWRSVGPTCSTTSGGGPRQRNNQPGALAWISWDSRKRLQRALGWLRCYVWRAPRAWTVMRSNNADGILVTGRITAHTRKGGGPMAMIDGMLQELDQEAQTTRRVLE